MGLSVKYFYLTMMLVLVLTPLGRTVNGSTRWIPMLVFNVQVSEVAKLCLIAYLAGYAVRRRDELLNTWPGFLKPLVVLGLASVLLVIQPDFEIGRASCRERV